MKPVKYLLFILVLLASSVWSLSYISDKRTEQINWMPGIHCTERTISSTGLYMLPSWDGPAQFYSISYKNISSYSVDVPDYDCSMCKPEDDNCQCKMIGSHKEPRTDITYIPISTGTKTAGMNTIISANSVDLKSDKTSIASVKIPYVGVIRMCWKISSEDVGSGGHIIYIASDGDINSDVDHSTFYNITNSSIYFTAPTSPNNTIANMNYTEVNVSIITDNLGTFKFNWNGTNTSIYDQSLILAMNFNNNAAIGETNTNVNDSSMYNLNATANTSLLYSTGRFNLAINLSGNTHIIVVTTAGISNSLNQNGSSSITQSVWINPNSGGVTQYIFARSTDSTDASGTLRLNASNNPTFMLTTTTGYLQQNFDTPIPLNTWSQITITYNGSEVDYYLNGRLKQTIAKSGTINLSRVSGLDIGASNVPPYSSTFNGSIDELRIYNRSLSASEIGLQYNSEFQKYNSSEYRFYDNITNLSYGTYTYSGWANDTGGNAAGTDSNLLRYLTLSNSTTTSTTSTSTTMNSTSTTVPTSTTSSSSTSTTTPSTLPANSTLYIFTVLFPVLATIFTLAAIILAIYGNKGILPSLFASSLWYFSAMTSTQIRFPGDFTVSMDTKMVDPGNWEIGQVFLVFAMIMAVHTMILVLDFIYSSNKENG